MAGKFTKLALLSAGLFLSIKSFAAGECLGYAGTIIPSMEFTGTDCPVISFTTPVDDVKCEIVRAGNFVCAIGSGDENIFGGPWKYTGGLFDPLDGVSPTPLPPMTPPPPLVAPTWTPFDVTETNTSQFSTNTTNSLINLTNRINAIATFLSEDAVLTKNQLLDSTERILEAQSATNTHIYDNTNVILSALSGTNQGLRNHAEALSLNIDRNASVRHDILMEEINSKIPQRLDAIDANIGGFYNELNLFQASNAESELRELEALSKLDENRRIAVNINETSIDTREMISDLADSVADISSGGGGGLTSSESAMLSSIQSATSQLWGMSDTINSKTRGAVQDAAFSTQNTVWASNSQIMGYMGSLNSTQTQTLSEIKDAIESSSGGAGEPTDLTETNEKLNELITGSALINDNLVTNGVNNGNALQQTTNAVNALGEKLDGIGEGIDGLNDSLSAGSGQLTGPEKCEGPHCWKSKSWIETSYEEGMKTVWDEHKLAFNSSAMKSYLDGMFPKFGGSGGLEPAQFCFDMGFVNFGCFTLTIPPYVIAFIRICLLISAGFYCQRLIFGGA